jgi:hypothetical protein
MHNHVQAVNKYLRLDFLAGVQVSLEVHLHVEKRKLKKKGLGCSIGLQSSETFAFTMSCTVHIEKCVE